VINKLPLDFIKNILYNNIMIRINLNKLYKEEISNISFGSIKKENLIEALKDGRASSSFIELLMLENHPELIKAQTKDYDFKLKKSIDGLLTVEEKLFTKLGCKFYPSRMIGVGRKLNESEATKAILKNVYLIVNITEMPTICYKFIKGRDLLKRYPKFKITPKEKEQFFA
jgi:hypothetical protein